MDNNVWTPAHGLQWRDVAYVAPPTGAWSGASVAYKVGDKVPQRIHERAGEGEFLDGVYSAIGDRMEEGWVVIRNGAIAALVSSSVASYTDEWQKEREQLIVTWGVQFNRGLWTEEAWEAKAELERIDEEKFQAWCKDKGYDPKNPGTAATYYIQQRMSEQSVTRQILQKVDSGP